MQGAQGTIAQTCQLGVITLTEPVDAGDACLGRVDVIGENAGLCAEGMPGGEQEVVALVTGIGREQQATAGSLQQGRRWAGCVQGIGRGLAQAAGEQDGTVGLVGQFDEGGQAAGQARNGTGRIQDDQAGVQEADHGGQVVQVLGESERACAGEGTRSILDEGTQEQDMGGVASGSLQARFEGVGGAVVGGQQDDVACLGGGAVGKGRAAGDAGGQGEGEQGEATVGGAIEQGEVTQGDATGPEPAEGFAGDVREEVDCWQGSRRFFRLLLGNFAVEVAQEAVEVAVRCHREDPFGVITCAREKGIDGETTVEGRLG